MNYLLVIDNVAIQDSDRRNEHNEELACVGAQLILGIIWLIGGWKWSNLRNLGG